MRTLVVMGHPRRESLSAALAGAYFRGAVDAGCEVRSLVLADIEFDLNVNHPTPHLQPDEPSLATARELVLWAEHLVLVYPTWWGTMPALLKGFVDRIFISGFSFVETEGGTGYEPLFRGKTAQLITSMDTPGFVYNLIYHAPGKNALAKATLGFCGYSMAPSIVFRSVRYSSPQQRTEWLESAYAHGFALKRGALSPTRRWLINAGRWMKALRLQFYPMTFIAYSVGALLAEFAGYGWSTTFFCLGYAWIFFAEVLTVFANEYIDQFSDDRNHYYGPFNGGSRVLTNGEISRGSMRKAIGIVTVITLLLLGTLLLQPATMNGPSITASLTLLIVAIGYTVPPLKLSYRGLGELTVGVTHSAAVVLCGFLYQGGAVSDPGPWLVSLPLFLSVLPSIILAGVPDRAADASAGKKTIAVRVGHKNAAVLAIIFTVCALVTVVLYALLDILPAVFNNMLYFVVPHAVLLCWMLNRYLTRAQQEGRIDALIIAALTYLTWFAVVPLVNLL